MRTIRNIIIVFCILGLSVAFAKPKKNKKNRDNSPAEMVTQYTPPPVQEETPEPEEAEPAQEEAAQTEETAAAEQQEETALPEPEVAAQTESEESVAQSETAAEEAPAATEESVAQSETAAEEAPAAAEESVAQNEAAAEETVAQEETSAEEAPEPAQEVAVESPAQEETAAVEPAPVEQKPQRRDPRRRIYLFDGYESYDTYSEAEDQPKRIENPDKKDKNGRTMLQVDAANDKLETIEQLLASDASIDLTDNDLWTPLMYAARYAKKRQTIAALIEAGANTAAKNKFGATALKIAAAHSKSAEVVDELAKHYSKNALGVAFITAVSVGRSTKVVEVFLKRGISANSIYKGKSALMYAAEKNTSTDCIKFLLENGADKTLVTADRKDAYYFATQNPNLPRNSIFWSLNNSESE